ncbi:hypothetical protein MLD38_023570 [Melastoma candidum]|uniref:Uncharacterized protein n=1 Tax=Melastoma candidum TaxID=119954 RepID=A0ACB9NUI0_9MYRT|nr:hypothetical protein MLD38_023570 [Melastoma candidum]
MFGDRHGAEEARRGAPHGVILAIVVAAVTAFPHVIGEPGEVILEAISELFTPVGLLILAVTLLLTIQVLSSDRSDVLRGFFTAEGICGSRDSPVGVVLFLLIVLFLLYNRGSLLGGGDDGDDE